MSAVNIFPTGEALHIFTDGALCEPADGRLKCVTSKLHLVPRLSAVVAVRGSETAMRIVGRLADLAETFDLLVRGLGDRLRDSWHHISLFGLGEIVGPAEVFVAGFNEAGEPDIWMASTSGSEPFASRPVGFIVSPIPPPPFDPFDIESFDPVGDGVALMQSQRQIVTTAEEPFAAGCGTVGGYVQHTVVTPDAITTRVAHRWPDRIGERIAA